MEIGRRSSAVLVLAIAGALSVAGIAWATNSTVSFKIKCSGRSVWNKCPKTTRKPGQINVHTHTNYTNVNANYTNRAVLYFDNDGRVNPAATPKCAKSKISGTKTMKQAMAACGNALIGKGTAAARAGSNTVHACVLAFNGRGTGGHVLLFTRANASPPFTINCSSPRTNTHGNTNVLLDGQLSAANIAGYGKKLDFRNIHAASPLPLVDFNVTVGKPTVANAKNYISARCSHGNHTWKLRTKFTYNGGTVQTVNATRRCTVG